MTKNFNPALSNSMCRSQEDSETMHFRTNKNRDRQTKSQNRRQHSAYSKLSKHMDAVQSLRRIIPFSRTILANSFRVCPTSNNNKKA